MPRKVGESIDRTGSMKNCFSLAKSVNDDSEDIPNLSQLCIGTPSIVNSGARAWERTCELFIFFNCYTSQSFSGIYTGVEHKV